MANVVDSVDRAQLILVSGLMIAVTLLVLVLLLNTVIYTENVATRGIDSDVSDAADFQETIDEEIAKLLEKEHSAFNGSDWTELSDSVNGSAAIIFEQQSNRAIQRGHIADASVNESIRGIEIDSEGNGTVASGVNQSRQFEVTVNSLTEESHNVTIGSTTVRIHETESGGNISIDDDEICTFEGSEDVAVSFTNGTVVTNGAHEECDELRETFKASLGDGATIEIEEHRESSFTVKFVGSTDSTGSPDFDHTWIVYELTVDISYQSSDLEYSTERTISGERHD